MKYHPDKAGVNNSVGTGNRFKEIAEAYETLNDKAQRK